MIRAFPFALQGSSKVPTPDDLSGQGRLGFFSAAVGAGALEADALATGGGAGGGLLALGAAFFGASFSHAMIPIAKTAVRNIRVSRVLTFVSVRSAVRRRRPAQPVARRRYLNTAGDRYFSPSQKVPRAYDASKTLLLTAGRLQRLVVVLAGGSGVVARQEEVCT